jgi:HK97 gp10 family phage protein
MEKVLANLEAFNLRTQREVKVAVKETAESACEVAKSLTPVSPDGSHGNPPGTLRDGNEVRAGISGSSGAFLSNTIGGGSITYELYNDVFYAGYVCLGTRYMSARDFMTPALSYGRGLLYAKLAAIIA